MNNPRAPQHERDSAGYRPEHVTITMPMWVGVLILMFASAGVGGLLLLGLFWARWVVG